MNKIEEIEKLLAKWKAIDADDKMNGYSGFGEVNRGVIALEAALKILKRPSNTQLKIDAGCPSCKTYHKQLMYCRVCGNTVSGGTT
ncbi:hypothetical protein H8E88_02500 [candidate division KSB1 bacterium]|nr:hypothetical protein [candidate division KSB1 bacterium]